MILCYVICAMYMVYVLHLNVNWGGKVRNIKPDTMEVHDYNFLYSGNDC